MLRKRFELDCLRTPAFVKNDRGAVEVMRVWASDEEGFKFVLKPTWVNAAMWGLLLVDVARHAANAYANQGDDRGKVLAEIKAMFDAEWKRPTDPCNQVQDFP
jgi:hypothetical protein